MNDWQIKYNDYLMLMESKDSKPKSYSEWKEQFEIKAAPTTKVDELPKEILYTIWHESWELAVDIAPTATTDTDPGSPLHRIIYNAMERVCRKSMRD